MVVIASLTDLLETTAEIKVHKDMKLLSSTESKVCYHPKLERR